MWLRLLPLLAATLALGCDRSGIGQTYPVRGTITLRGEPLNAKSTTVLFKPDVARGNRTALEPTGTVDSTGQYKLITQGSGGAPPGWYKVIVTAYGAAPEHSRMRGARPVIAPLVPAKYGLAESTPLSIEVVADPVPGAYDLKLSP